MGSSDSGKEHLLSVIWNFHPDMVFFVLARVLRKTKELLEAATKARPAPPVIAVVDEHRPAKPFWRLYK
jgi:hypothetical protein